MASTTRSKCGNPGAGLTLVEVIVAILVFTIGGLGLATGSAVMVRQMSRTNLRAHSASIARSRDEMFHATPCAALADGEDTRSGVQSVWRVSPGNTTTLDQKLERSAMSERHADRYLSAAPCD
jgi:Tfp pilus assembly protein PilV